MVEPGTGSANHGAAYEEREFFKQPLSTKELEGLIGRREVSDFFSRRSPSVKKMGLDVDALDDAAMKRLMREEPRLMRRPVLTVGRKVLIGFDPDAWDDALG